MHRKGAQDVKRARMFAKLTREIIVAAKTGLLDPNSNPRLRSALAAARGANMPKDNIDRALKKVAGGEDTAHYEEVRYEGYGTAGVAVIVEALTDNRNRTASEVRSIFNKYGGSLGESGSVAFQFERIGYLRYPATAGFDAVFEQATEAGANDVIATDEGIDVVCTLDDFAVVRDYLVQQLGDALEAKIIWRPLNTLACDTATSTTLLKMIDALDACDDVQNVYANCQLAVEAMEQLET